MKIISNESPYDARAIRRILMTVYRSLASEFRLSLHFWPSLFVSLHAGRTRAIKATSDRKRGMMKLILPALRGDEFVGLLRQQHGTQTGIAAAPVGLQTAELALLVQNLLFKMMDVRTRRWQRRTLRAQKPVSKLPAFVPIRILKPEQPKRSSDRIQESYDRVLVLERKWQTRAKLAATKLKGLRRKRIYYEKRLAARKETQ